MSNKETLGQRRRKSKLALKTLKAQKAEQDHAFEVSLFDSFRERVEAGEFESVDQARLASALVFDVDPSQETKDALEAFLDLDREWAALNTSFKQGLEAADSLEEQWARDRAALIANLNQETNGFARTFPLEVNDDGSAVLSAEAVELLTMSAFWVDQGKIGKASSYLNSTPSGALSLRFKINNPSKVKS